MRQHIARPAILSSELIVLALCAGLACSTSAVQVQPTWASFYDGIAQGTGRDEGFDLAIAADGSVAVTGRSWGELNVFDFITIKYAPDGSELWTRRYDGPLEQIDEAYAVGMDAAGNVIVTGASYTGQSFSGGSDWDYVTIKYLAKGDVAWERRYNGPGNSWDIPSDIEVDGAGNAYVAGFSFKQPTRTGVQATHFHLLKYNPQGNIVWQHHLDLNPHLGAGARDMTLDAAGNAYALRLHHALGWRVGRRHDGRQGESGRPDCVHDHHRCRRQRRCAGDAHPARGRSCGDGRSGPSCAPRA